MRKTIIFLLASKSSGSSAFQNYLCKNYGAALVRHTPHHENETLFWAKAASILRLPQSSMHRSSVPYSYSNAIAEIKRLSELNSISLKGIDLTSKNDLMELFYKLLPCESSLVFEKSPHHLFNHSNLQLMQEFAQHFRGIADVHFLGLIRSPRDTVYSAWNRWRYNCKRFEEEWTKSYRNLLDFAQDRIGIKIFRYEDLVRSPSTLDEYMTSLGQRKISNSFQFSAASVGKGNVDPSYLHRLSPATIEIATAFGYVLDQEPAPRLSSLWRLKQITSDIRFSLRRHLIAKWR